MKLLFAGTPATALPTLAALRAAGHDVVAVATNPDAPTGRGRHMVASPVAAEAAALGIPLLQPKRAREPWFVDAVTALHVDVAVIVAWGCLIPDALLDVPQHGWVNLHFSVLPAWRGAAPVQRAIMAGEPTSGVTTFRLVHDLDAGPIWRQQVVDVGPDETAGDVLDSLAQLGAQTMVQTLDDIAAGVAPQPQSADGVTLAPKVTADDARIDWTGPAQAIHDQVRGTTPAPGAWTTLRGQRLKLVKTRLVTPEETLAAGELLSTKRELLIGAGDGVIELVAVQGVGKPPMSGADWARGARPQPGERCE
ncbi:MAG: methionyl-tRNA formyltransferase [Propionibacteriaceae bacterium]|nr:methionyl-tRNA formyltransferase [Propionibacteriaceae bacterium]